MREAEYHLLDPNAHLPLYDYDDRRADEVDGPTPDDVNAYSGLVHRVREFGDAQVMLADKSLVFRGGLRFPGASQPYVIAYFWERQTPNPPPPVILQFPSNETSG